MEILKEFQLVGLGIPNRPVRVGEYLPELRAYLGDVRKSVQTEVLEKSPVTVDQRTRRAQQEEECPRRWRRRRRRYPEEVQAHSQWQQQPA